MRARQGTNVCGIIPVQGRFGTACSCLLNVFIHDVFRRLAEALQLRLPWDSLMRLEDEMHSSQEEEPHQSYWTRGSVCRELSILGLVPPGSSHRFIDSHEGKCVNEDI